MERIYILMIILASNKLVILLVYCFTPNTEATDAINQIPLKFTLVWNDESSPPSTGVKLINNLDLVVTTPNSETIFGNAKAGQTANTQRDNLNNAEQVVITQPVAGTYKVDIQGIANPNGAVINYAFTATGRFFACGNNPGGAGPLGTGAKNSNTVAIALGVTGAAVVVVGLAASFIAYKKGYFTKSSYYTSPKTDTNSRTLNTSTTTPTTMSITTPSRTVPAPNRTAPTPLARPPPLGRPTPPKSALNINNNVNGGGNVVKNVNRPVPPPKMKTGV